MLEQSVLEEIPVKVERINDPREWLESQTINGKDDGKKVFTFIDPTPEEIELGQRVRNQYENEIKRFVPEDDRILIEAPVDYLNAPTFIFDDKYFPTEKIRNIWQQMIINPQIQTGVNPELGRFFESNKLKGNTIIGILGIAGTEESVAQNITEHEASVVPLYSLAMEYLTLFIKYQDPENPNAGYDNMSINEKINFKKDISAFALRLAEREALVVPLIPLAAEYLTLFKKYRDSENPNLGYDNMSINEKIAFTKEISAFALRLYEFLAEKYRPKMMQ